MKIQILYFALLLAVSTVYSDPIRKVDLYDTIVVGCGVSGLAAISELDRRGKRAVCLEASDRIGGRVRTVEFGDGIVELGAEWIHGTVNSKTYDLALSHNVTLKSQDGLQYFYRSDTGKVSDNITEILNNMIELALDADQDVVEKPEPMGNYIVRKCNKYLEKNYPEFYEDKKSLGEFYKTINQGLAAYDAANDWNDLSTSSTYEDLGGDLHMSWHRLGYKTLFDIILNKYNGGEGVSAAVMVNKEVMNIAWSDEEVVVKCRDGSQYSAPHVIITTSVGVLKERHAQLFTPPLPKEKQDAINDINMGVLTKIVVAYDNKWWKDDKKEMGSLVWSEEARKSLSPDEAWLSRVSITSRPMGSDNTMTLWASGEVGKQIETMDSTFLKNGVTRILRTFFGKDIPEASAIIRTVWHSNPWTRGSYTFDGVGMSLTSRSVLGAPINDSKGKLRLLFAGEATNVKHFSTVHGAYETGVREADRITSTV